MLGYSVRKWSGLPPIFRARYFSFPRSLTSRPSGRRSPHAHFPRSLLPPVHLLRPRGGTIGAHPSGRGCHAEQRARFGQARGGGHPRRLRVSARLHARAPVHEPACVRQGDRRHRRGPRHVRHRHGQGRGDRGPRGGLPPRGQGRLQQRDPPRLGGGVRGAYGGERRSPGLPQRPHGRGGHEGSGAARGDRRQPGRRSEPLGSRGRDGRRRAPGGQRQPLRFAGDRARHLLRPAAPGRPDVRSRRADGE